MTVSSRCSELLSVLLIAVVSVLSSLQAYGQRNAWSVPQYKESVRVGSVGYGHSFARDTYLSESRYDGWNLGLEFDSWKGLKPGRLFNTGRVHASLFFSPMSNRSGGGKTYQAAGTAYFAGLWHAVDCSMCDLLVGPAGMVNIGALWNLQNSNNPANGEGYLAAGVCVDNTLRYRLFGYPMALQATLYLPLAGVGIAPDYDKPYWFVYRYGEYGSVLHFISPFNNAALTQQVSLLLPVRSSCIRIGYTFDYIENRLGGHFTRLFNGYFTVGYAAKIQTLEWR